MALAHWLYSKRAWLCWSVLVSATSSAAFAAGNYNGNNNGRLGSPTQEQTDKALEAGEKFRERQSQPAPVGPAAVIPESYSAETRLNSTTPPPQEDYHDYRWRWGPRVFWPCERFDPYWEYSIYLWGEEPHQHDRAGRADLFDMWCPPFYDRNTRHPEHRGGP